jgi:hypothetical protein
MDVDKALDILALCAAAMSHVDKDLLEWRFALDRIALEGAGLSLPLVWHKDGERVEVGTARLIHDDGALYAIGEVTENIPELKPPAGSYSLSFGSDGHVHMTAIPESMRPKALSGAKAHFHIDAEGNMYKFVSGVKGSLYVDTDATERLHGVWRDGKLREKIRAKIDEHLYLERRLENHPFFNEKEND